MANERCPFADGCRFYEELRLEGSYTVIVRLYCEGQYEKCARYKVRTSGGEVPRDLWPDMILNGYK